MNHTYNINEDRVREVLRVKSNMGCSIHEPVDKPLGVKTVEPKIKLELEAWFKHINNSLREKDLFGRIKNI